MSYYHKRKTYKKYAAYPKSDRCHFCHPEERDEPVTEEGKLSYVTPNRTFYDQWELRTVVDHLMVIPKRHVLAFKEMTAAEKAEIMDFIAKYESLGYEIYARSPVSASRSQAHQHTHLIKTEGAPKNFMLFLRKPRIMWRV